MNNQVNCRFFEDHINAYLDSELDPETRSKMISHADACPDCGERLETMTRLLTMCAELDEGLTVPLEVQSAWRRAVREEAAQHQSQPRAKKGRGIRRTLGTVAAAAVLLVGGTFLYQAINLEQAAISVPVAPTQKRMQVSGSGYDGGYVSEANQSPGTQSAMYLSRDGAIDNLIGAEEDNMLYEEDTVDVADVADVADSTTQQRVVLRNATRWFETSTFDPTMQSITDLVTEYNGHFEDQSVDGQAILPGQTSGRIARLTARLPVNDLDEFLSVLDGLGTLTYQNQQDEDISSRYYDVASRLESYRAQLKRYNELVSTASGLEEMLLLQDKLYEVQANVDSLEGQIRGWDSRANMSTVAIEVSEIALREQQSNVSTLDDRVRGGFADSMEWMRVFLQDAAVVLAMAAPMLVIVVPLLIVLGVIISAVKRRKRRKGK